MRKFFQGLGKFVLWVITVPTASFYGGHHVGTEQHKQHCVEHGAAEWKADKTGKVQFHLKGAENVR